MYNCIFSMWMKWPVVSHDDIWWNVWKFKVFSSYSKTLVQCAGSWTVKFVIERLKMSVPRDYVYSGFYIFPVVSLSSRVLIREYRFELCPRQLQCRALNQDLHSQLFNGLPCMFCRIVMCTSELWKIGLNHFTVVLYCIVFTTTPRLNVCSLYLWC